MKIRQRLWFMCVHTSETCSTLYACLFSDVFLILDQTCVHNKRWRVSENNAFDTFIAKFQVGRHFHCRKEERRSEIKTSRRKGRGLKPGLSVWRGVGGGEGRAEIITTNKSRLKCITRVNGKLTF